MNMKHLRPRLLLLLLLGGVCAQAQTFDSRKTYEIYTADGLLLDNQSSVKTESALMMNQPEAGNTAQVWQILPLGKGLYQLVNGYSFQALDNGGTREEQPVIQWPQERENVNQHWKITRLKDGTYTLVSAANGMALGLRNKAAYGEKVWQLKADAASPLQRWRIRESATQVEFIVPKTASANDWENEKVFAIGKEPGHPTLIPYATEDEMVADAAYERPWERTASSRYFLLNGKWKFNWVKAPEERPVNFYKPSFDVSG